MKHYLLIYHLVDDYLERRAEFRDEHLSLAWEAQQKGDLVLGGALKNPADRAVLLFKTTSPELVESFAENDPYVKHGLVAKWEVREWTTVVGDDAIMPVKPGS